MLKCQINYLTTFSGLLGSLELFILEVQLVEVLNETLSDSHWRQKGGLAVAESSRVRNLSKTKL